MATYQLLVFSWNDIFPTRAQSGASEHLVGETFTFTGGNGDIVNYTDNDGWSTRFTDHGITENRIHGTIDGQYVDNDKVNPEYAYELTDSNGNVMGKIYAITTNYNNLALIEGFVFDFKPVQGETYTLSKLDTVPDTYYSNLYVCFAAGTLIETPTGPAAVEDLSACDLVMTRDRGPRPVIWTGRRHIPHQSLVFDPRLRPVLIEPGALGSDAPDTPLVVSPQHRICLCSRVAQRMFGSAAVMVPAKKLLGLGGVRQFVPDNGVTYHHLLCEYHEVIRANGSWAETLFLGKMTEEILGADQLDEIHQLHPDLAERMRLHPLARLAETNRKKLNRLVTRETQRRGRHIGKKHEPGPGGIHGGAAL